MPKKLSMIFVLIFAIVALIIIWAVFSLVLGRPNPALKKTEVAIAGKIFQVEIASTTVERARGLSGREGLAEGEGMLFLFGGFGNYGFWMKDMKFSIDIIWLAGNRAAGFSENAVPEPGVPLWKLKIYYPPEPIDKVLEVNAGTVKKNGIKIGDAVALSAP